MTKKDIYYPEAERLFVYEQCTFQEIADRLKLSEKTVRLWKDAAGDWEIKKKAYLESRKSLHEELYFFGRELLQAVRQELATGQKVSNQRLFMLGKILPTIVKPKDYEEVKKQKEKETATGDTNEEIALNIIEALGLKDEKS